MLRIRFFYNAEAKSLAVLLGETCVKMGGGPDGIRRRLCLNPRPTA